MRKLRLVALALMALLVFACAGMAQNEKKKKSEDQNRSVEGLVTAADESPAIGAVVKLKNLKSLQIRSFITKENGSYYFHQLSPDIDYELTADFQGSSSPTKTLSSFDSRKKAVINLKVNPKK